MDPDDRPILGMLIHGVSEPEICDVLRLDPAQLHARRARMLATLRAPAAEESRASART
jgi:hypothetical protein